jgi:hypothetical protein
MKIAFLTACLEPARDGVGDYTRDLAVACGGSPTCVVAALNDPYVEAPREEHQTARDVAVSALRLPASSTWPARVELARQWLERHSPDWVSLQFVPYGYHAKGIVAGLARWLAPLVHGRRLHWMFHELWIGLGDDARLRERLVGVVQRQAVLRLLAALEPAVVHTTNDAYVAVLEQHGVRAARLPLSGSIPLVRVTGADWLGAELAAAGVTAGGARERDTSWRFGLFGSLHPVWAPEPLFTYIAAAARAARRHVVIASIGRLGPGEALWAEIGARYRDTFSFAALGERSTSDVSRFLQGIDFGLATTPWQVIGKSATAAAMLDHGVPVIVSRDEFRIRGLAAPGGPGEPLLHRMDERLGDWLGAAVRLPPRDRLPDTARRLVTDLELAAAERRRLVFCSQ